MQPRSSTPETLPHAGMSYEPSPGETLVTASTWPSGLPDALFVDHILSVWSCRPEAVASTAAVAGPVAMVPAAALALALVLA